NEVVGEGKSGVTGRIIREGREERGRLRGGRLSLGVNNLLLTIFLSIFPLPLLCLCQPPGNLRHLCLDLLVINPNIINNNPILTGDREPTGFHPSIPTSGLEYSVQKNLIHP